MTEHKELIEALERADEPSRELDALIVKALYPAAIIEPYCLGDDEPVVFHAEPLVINKRELPCYTASIDAALTLVTDGSEWQVTNIYGRNHADVDLNSGHGSYSSGAKNHPATPAIAICIAALKAEQSNG